MTNLVSDAISQVYVAKNDIVDNLTTNDSNKVLSAKQGKTLKDLLGNIGEAGL